MTWEKHIFRHSRVPYHQDLRLAIEVLTEAFESNLGLTPRMGKEWEFIITAVDQEKQNLKALDKVVSQIYKKIEDANRGLLKLRKGSGYERFYVDNGAAVAIGEMDTPILEITTQVTNPLHSAQLIDLFQRMLEKELEPYGFHKEVNLMGAERNIICGMHDNVSFLGDGGIIPSENTAESLTDIMSKVSAATPSVMLLYAPSENSYRRYLPEFSGSPDVIGFGKKPCIDPSMIHYTYNPIIYHAAPESSRIENRAPSADANPFEVTLGTLLVFYNAMRKEPYDCGVLQNNRAGMGSLEEALQIFESTKLLERTINELSPGLGSRIHSAILSGRPNAKDGRPEGAVR